MVFQEKTKLSKNVACGNTMFAKANLSTSDINWNSLTSDDIKVYRNITTKTLSCAELKQHDFV